MIKRTPGGAPKRAASGRDESVGPSLTDVWKRQLVEGKFAARQHRLPSAPLPAALDEVGLVTRIGLRFRGKA